MELGVTFAFLGIGAGELLLVALLLVVLFGVERIPDVARALGRAQARFSSARDEIVDTLELERSGLTREQVAFERAREHQIRQQVLPDEPAEGNQGDARMREAPEGDKRAR